MVKVAMATGRTSAAALAISGLLAMPWMETAAAESPDAKGGSRHAVAMASAFRLTGTSTRTSVRLEVNRPIAANVFTLADPYRAIVDVPQMDFRLPPSPAGRNGRGLVKAYRYGSFEGGRSRVVMDLAAPVRIEKAMFSPPVKDRPGHLTFDLVRIPPEEFIALGGGSKPEAPARPAPLPGQRDAAADLRSGRYDEALPRASGTPQPKPRTSGKTRPVIVIDPGHGGVDPGTVAATDLTEKVVVLAVALRLKSILTQSRRYEVVLTRSTDTFLSLARRVEISRSHDADLFISIHADALAEKDLARTVSGASIYTLSEKASNETARRLAEKENAADLIAGLANVPASDEDQVRSILLDLVHRETANFSFEIRNLIARNFTGRVPLARDPQRSAAFRVLKQAETPAVLIELGYMSNEKDLSRLSKAEWRQQVANLIAQAVDAYFARRKRPGGR
jgi:N-acetylmuramoyl-L-alanine amidase